MSDKLKQKYTQEINTFPDNAPKESVLSWLQDTEHYHKQTNSEKHLGVVVYITPPENDKVFLLEHKKAQTWLMPGGHVDQDKLLRQTAVEELAEELNLDVLGFKLEPIHIAEVPTSGKNSGHIDVTLCYKLEVQNEEAVGQFIQEKEADKAKWYGLDEADKLPEFTNVPAINEKVRKENIDSIKKLANLDIETVVFDYGGVFADHYCYPYYPQLVAELKIDEYLVHQLLSETSEHGKAYRLNQITRDEFWKVVVDNSNNPNVDINLLESLWEKSYQPDPRMLSLAYKLRQAGKKVYLLMNSDVKRTKFIKEDSTIQKYVDGILSSCEIGFIKPNKNIYSEVIKSMRAEPNRIIYLDDRPSHVDAAREQGINGINYHPVQSPINQILDYKNLNQQK